MQSCYITRPFLIVGKRNENISLLVNSSDLGSIPSNLGADKLILRMIAIKSVSTCRSNWRFVDKSEVAMIHATMETYLLLTRILTFVSHFVLSTALCSKNVVTI